MDQKGYSFRKLEEKDIEWARVLHNDPEVLKMLTDPREVSKEQQKSWFEGLQKSKSSERWVAEHKGAPIGVIRIDHIDRNNNSVCIGLDIHKDFRGKGHAKPVYSMIFRHWFDKEKMNRLWLLVAKYNEVALNLYKKLGFKEEGVQRQGLFRDGKYHDYVMMSLLKKEYDELKKSKVLA